MSQQKKQENEVRPFARVAARELSREEVDVIAGGVISGGGGRGGEHTHATGPNGDDPGDPGDVY